MKTCCRRGRLVLIGLIAQLKLSFQYGRYKCLVMHLSIFCPAGGKTIPDRREFDKLMESVSRVIDNYYLTAPRGI